MKNVKIQRISSAVMILILYLVGFNIISVSGAGELVVTQSNLQGWDFSESGAYNFNPAALPFADGPGTPPLGTGSLTANIDISNKKLFFHQTYANGVSYGIPASTLALSYSTFTDTTATNLNNWYANIYVVLNPSGSPLPGDPTFWSSPNCLRLDFVPANNPADATWRNYALTDAQNMPTTNNRCGGAASGVPTTWGNFKSTYPNALIWRIALSMGDTSSSYVGYSGALDNVIINSSVYDFELNPPVVVTPEPEITDEPVVISTPVIGCVLAPPAGLDMTNAPDNTYCRSLMSNGAVISYSGAVPANLIQAGVIRAIDIFRLEGGRSINTFPNYVQVCLLGDGRFIYMDATQAPRQAVEMPSSTSGTGDSTYTCAWIPNPGTVILINK